MKQYRITKYDPAKRHPDGTYSVDDEWTSYQDINESVSEEDYLKCEVAYIKTAIKFLNENQISSLRVKDLYDQENISSLKENEILPVSNLEHHLRNVLREEYSCKFENDNCFVHVGWDFYMYVGVMKTPSNAIDFAERNSLFVEEYVSPYIEK